MSTATGAGTHAGAGASGDATVAGGATAAALAVEDRSLAHNYSPLPVVIASGQGAWVTDVDGKRYLDGLAAYSAVNFGHGNPRLLDAARAQLDRVTLTSRAFVNDRLGPFAAALASLTDTELVLPMNTGAEAVESAIKVSRAWGYRVKGVPAGQATIIVASGNFHGRTTTIVSFSDDPSAREDFGPYTPGFRTVPYGDAAALREAMDETVVAVLLEPIQGEGGVVIPPESYLPEVRAVCDEFGALFVADEIQSGLGRTGHTLAVSRVGVRPDLITLGKALGGGIVPVSAVVGSREVLGVLRPANTDRRSAATRSRPPSGPRSSRCSARARSSSARSTANRCSVGCSTSSSGTGSSRTGSPDSGRGSTSTPRSAPARRSRTTWPTAACS